MCICLVSISSVVPDWITVSVFRIITVIMAMRDGPTASAAPPFGSIHHRCPGVAPLG